MPYAKPGDIPWKNCRKSGKKNGGCGAGLKNGFCWFPGIERKAKEPSAFKPDGSFDQAS